MTWMHDSSLPPAKWLPGAAMLTVSFVELALLVDECRFGFGYNAGEK